MTTFANLSSPFPNFLFSAINNFLADTNLWSSDSRFFSIFSFQIFANLPYIYIKIYYTCSSTISFLILILKYNLYAITNLTAFSESLSNNGSLATSITIEDSKC